MRPTFTMHATPEEIASLRVRVVDYRAVQSSALELYVDGDCVVTVWFDRGEHAARSDAVMEALREATRAT